MSNELKGITNQTVRDTVGTYALNAANIVVDGANVENVSTATAVEHVINGVFMDSPYAQTDELDLSGVTVINGKNGEVLGVGATYEHPALAAGDDTQTLVYILACIGATPYIIENTLDVAAGQDAADYELSCPAGFCPWGLIKIVQAPTDSVGVAAFQLGVDDLTGITGRTSTFFDIAKVPPSVALILEANGA